MKTRIIAVFLLCISLVFCSCAKTEEKTEEVKVEEEKDVTDIDPAHISTLAETLLGEDDWTKPLTPGTYTAIYFIPASGQGVDYETMLERDIHVWLEVQEDGIVTMHDEKNNFVTNFSWDENGFYDTEEYILYEYNGEYLVVELGKTPYIFAELDE